MQNPVSNEAMPLVNFPPEPARTCLTKPTILLLIMIMFGSALQYDMGNFNIEDYTTNPNNTNACSSVPYEPQGNTLTGGAAMLLAAAATYILAALGGILSDMYSICLKLIGYSSVAVFLVSALFLLLIQLSIMCHNHTWFMMLGAGLAFSRGLNGPLQLYGVMQNADGSQSKRLLLLFAFLFVSFLSDAFGILPSLLRYLFRNSNQSQSFEFLGVFYSAAILVCIILLSTDSRACERLKGENFEFPTIRRLKRYYIIVTAFVPFISVMILCRAVFYWKEMQYYTSYDGFLNNTVVTCGFDFGGILFSLCGIILLLKNKFPRRLTLGIRLKSGLLLMMSSKLVLFLISFYHTEMSHLGHSHPIAVQAIYFVAAFTDGATNALTSLATYELVDWIAVPTAKAMCIGIFFTTWGMAHFMTAIVIAILRRLPSEGQQLMPTVGVQPQFYIRYAIGMTLLLLSYVHYSWLSIPLSESLMLTN